MNDNNSAHGNTTDLETSVVRSAAAYFARPSMLKLMEKTVTLLDSDSYAGIVPDGIQASLKSALQLIMTNASAFDEQCALNIQLVGEQLESRLNGFSTTSLERRRESVSTIFVLVFRFLKELEFNQQGDASFELRRVLSFGDEALETFPYDERQQIVYANYLMPASILRRMLREPGAQYFAEFSKSVKKAEEMSAEWESQIAERETLVKALASKLDGLRSSYNFAGLAHGFTNLIDTKRREKQRAFVPLVLLGALMILPMVAQVWFVWSNAESIAKWRETLLFSVPSLIALEVFLLYFFRVVLQQYRSVKAQQLQLDLRLALCQFIESYGEFAARTRGKNEATLSRFEGLVFSSLVSDEANIPSTFDGLEQLVNAIKAVKQ